MKRETWRHSVTLAAYLGICKQGILLNTPSRVASVHRKQLYMNKRPYEKVSIRTMKFSLALYILFLVNWYCKSLPSLSATLTALLFFFLSHFHVTWGISFSQIYKLINIKVRFNLNSSAALKLEVFFTHQMPRLSQAKSPKSWVKSKLISNPELHSWSQCDFMPPLVYCTLCCTLHSAHQLFTC